MGYIRTSRGLITRLACGEKDTLTNTVILSTRMLVHATCMSLQHRPSRSRHPPDEGGSPPHMTWHTSKMQPPARRHLSVPGLPRGLRPALPQSFRRPSYAISASATPPFHFDARRPRPPPTWTPAMQSAPQQRPPSISTRAGPARRRPGPQLRLQRLSNALHSNFLISPRCPQHAPRAPNHPPSAPTWLLSVVCCCALYVSLYDSLNLN